MTASSYRAEPVPQDVDDALPTDQTTGQEQSYEGEEWLAPAIEERPAGAGGRAVLGWTLGLLAAAWLAYTAWSAGRQLAGEPLTTPALAQWIAIGAGPLALLGLAWLIFGRTRRREAEAFTRSVVTMRHEARALEALLGVLAQRIGENHSALGEITNQLMGLGEEAAQRLGHVTGELQAGSDRLVAQGEALDRAASTARSDIGVLLEDLPRAEASARAMADALRGAGSEALDKAARFEQQLARLSERGDEAGQLVSEASQRLVEQLAAIEGGASAAQSQLGAAAGESSATIDALLQRSAEALEDIRSGIDIQATAVAALLDQSAGGLGQAAAQAAESVGRNIGSASEALDHLAERIAEQDSVSKRMLGEIGAGLARLDDRFARLAEAGDARAQAVIASLATMRGHLDALAQQATANEGSVEGLAERTLALRQSLEALAGDIGAAQAGTERVLAAAQAARPELEWAHGAAVDAGSRLEAGAGAIEAQHDRLAALLAAVDTGVGGAEKRLDQLAEAMRAADGEAARLSSETAPALVEALLQVQQTAAHAAQRAREAISGVIPESAGQLSNAARTALEAAVRDTVSHQLAEVELVAGRALEAARGVSQRLTQQMINIGQSAAALDAHLQETSEAQRAHDSEQFAKRVSLLIDSMHSASIDVGKILSDEVDDRAWSAYLKGDRGIFTRRASRLIGGGESKALAAHYDTDREFHDAVNRYVHDFEAMLRRVQAERDGGPLAVTLMSSDMGKLYAALAQVAAR